MELARGGEPFGARPGVHRRPFYKFTGPASCGALAFSRSPRVKRIGAGSRRPIIRRSPATSFWRRAFGASFVQGLRQVGLGPDFGAGTWFLTRLVGPGAGTRDRLTGRAAAAEKGRGHGGSSGGHRCGGPDGGKAEKEKALPSNSPAAAKFGLALTKGGGAL